MDPLTIIGLGAGLGQGLLSAFGTSDEEKLKRIREKEVDEALGQNKRERSRLLAQSPEAVRQQQAGAIQSGMAGALAQGSNIGAGSVAQSGLAGGDINSANIAGVKASVPVLGATAPYIQALGNTYKDKQTQENVLNQQLAQNSMDRGKLAEMTAYYADPSAGEELSHILSMMQGGVGMMHRLSALDDDLSGVDKTREELIGQENVNIENALRKLFGNEFQGPGYGLPKYGFGALVNEYLQNPFRY